MSPTASETRRPVSLATGPIRILGLIATVHGVLDLGAPAHRPAGSSASLVATVLGAAAIIAVIRGDGDFADLTTDRGAVR